MHLTAPEVGLMGTSAMVASGVPLAVGAAIAFSMKQTQRVAVTFFGDGATEEGEFYESLNLAALRKAPVIFVCENNLYSSHVHIKDRRPADNIPDLVKAHRMPAFRIDGNNVVAVYKTTREAVQNARAGRGPRFIECRTYRWRGHVGPNYDLEKGLRSKEELDEWMARCPIKILESRMIRDHLMTEAQVKAIREQVVEEVKAAIEWANLEKRFLDDAGKTHHMVYLETLIKAAQRVEAVLSLIDEVDYGRINPGDALLKIRDILQPFPSVKNEEN